MKKFVLSFLLLLNVLLLSAKERSFTVLQWNIWQEGTIVEGGYEAIVDEIVRLKPDFVTFSEVRNYHHTNFTQRVVDSLAQKGMTYYSFYSTDTGLLSRYPITDSTTVFPLNNDQGTIYRMLTAVHGNEIAVYTAHLDYRHCAYYNVRGYDGTNWKEIAKPITVAEVLAYNDASMRDDAIRKFIACAKQDIAQGRIVVIGGDFNEPSHLDWIRETKDMYDHHGLIVPWTVTLELDNAGFVDAYRQLYPDVLKYPGFTYPADNPVVPIKKLTWAPKSDERERIDYVFYYPHQGMKLVSAVIFGPEGLIMKGARMVMKSRDEYLKPLGLWPTDHKGLLVKFVLKK